MPNINQQKRRVKITARQRDENLRYRSAAKTLFKRLESAVADGDKDRISTDHGELVVLLDKAASKRAIDPNKAARKKSQAARLVAGQSASAETGSPAGGISTSARSSSSSFETRLAPLSAASSSASRTIAASS